MTVDKIRKVQKSLRNLCQQKHQSAMMMIAQAVTSSPTREAQPIDAATQFSLEDAIEEVLTTLSHRF